MASSDDEGETFPDAVSDYYFCDKDDEPVSFSNLPVQWNGSESSSADAEAFFLVGKVDNGLGNFYQQVKAWKFDILTTIPEISVLYKDNNWIKLKKPRKSYEQLIRSILISVHCLCFCKSKPEASGKSLWDYLSKVFSLYDTRPSENDLLDHINFIREAIKRDETLAKSKFLAAFVENPRKKNYFDEDVTKPSFIVDDINDDMQDDDIINQTEDNDSDGEDDHFDSVCAICDNGGSLTCCEGKCFRSFHATPDSEDAEDADCESLCLTAREVESLKGPNEYKCENCRYSLHQCFVCAELGSSNKSSNTEVFRCSSATCGHFYHPKCVAKLLQKNDKTEQETLIEKIAAGEPFICPAHKCSVCKQTENEKVEDLQFAVCRRCPKSYHRKCLPRDIIFRHQIGDDDEDEARAWDGLLSRSRALIYCIDHEIDPDIETPPRTTIYRNILIRYTEQQYKKKPAVKVTGGDSVDPSKKKSVLKSQKGVERSSAIKPEGSSKKRAAVPLGPESSKKKKVADASKNPLRRSLPTNVKKPSPNDGQPSLGSRFDFYRGTESNNLDKDETSVDDNNHTVAAKPQQTEVLPTLDDESKQRIMTLMREATSSVTLDEVKKYHKRKLPSTHAHSSRVDKSVILARVEGSVEALNVALKRLEEGCSVEDAMAVCEPGVIDQLLRWKDRLRVYLAPFLHGMRYTSFGRHFTKVEKLEKIVDKLHWYIEDGDMVVDFCCGANDFSCLMKKKLDEMGKKKCSYKNFDIARPKNDFNFEKRDWMTVSPKELPSGSRLVMGLNPPFGVNASLANQFINNALKFKPKLIILIVPPETERLDSSRRTLPYDLVWEDVELLAGKSFYLPGSVNVNDKQMDQWNNIPPPLSLWSRPSWSNKHKSIAQQHGHIPHVQQPLQSDENETKSSLAVDKLETENGLPAIKKDIKTTRAKNPRNKKRKKQSPGGSGTKSKQIIKEENGNQSSGKKTPHNQELKIEEHDDRDSNHQDQPQKLEEARAPVKAQKQENIRTPAEAPKCEVTQAPVVVQKNEITPAPAKAPKREVTQAPAVVQKNEITPAPAKAPKRELTQAPAVVQKNEITPAPAKAPKRELTQAPAVDQKNEITPATAKAPKRELTQAPAVVQKNEITPAPANAPKRETTQAVIEVQKNEVTQAPVEVQKPETRAPVEAQKHVITRVLSREIDVQKHEEISVPSRELDDQKPRATSREIEAQKHEKARAPSREIEAQKHEKARAPSREMETQKHEQARAPSREMETQKHEKARAPSRERETPRQEKTWGLPREYDSRKFENKRPSPHTPREFGSQKSENNRTSPHTPEYKVHDTDFSFVDVDRSDGRFNSAIDESTFSLQNDFGQSYDEYLVRKYSSSSEEPYIGATSHRRLDGANHVAPSYSVKPDHLQYPGPPGYERIVSRGSYFDEMGTRVGGGGGYSMARHEPGLTRYSTPDATPYNRTSTSATQRYAPRLDELNHVRMGGLGRSELPMVSRGVGGYRPPVNAPGARMDSMGFAPGPYLPYQNNSSGGWLNE